MADVLVNALTQITVPTSTDSFVMVDRGTNEGRILDATTFARGVLEVNCGTISSLPQTVQASGITDDMVVVNAFMGTPSAMDGNCVPSPSPRCWISIMPVTLSRQRHS